MFYGGAGTFHIRGKGLEKPVKGRVPVEDFLLQATKHGSIGFCSFVNRRDLRGLFWGYNRLSTGLRYRCSFFILLFFLFLRLMLGFVILAFFSLLSFYSFSSI